GSRLVTQGGLTDPGVEPPDVAVVWDTATWEPVGEPWLLDQHYTEDKALVLSPDGSLAAMPLPGGAAVGVWRVSDRSPLGTPVDVAALGGPDAGPVVHVAFAP